MRVEINYQSNQLKNLSWKYFANIFDSEQSLGAGTLIDSSRIVHAPSRGLLFTCFTNSNIFDMTN